MANVKITQLPAVTSVLSSDIFPVVASNVTSKLTVTNLANSLTQVTSSISASFASTASYYGGSVLNATSASFASTAATASYFLGTIENANSASYYAMPVASYAWTSGYFNLADGVDNNVRWNTEVFNNNSNVFALSGSGTADARIYIKQAGIYEIISQVHLYDLSGNMDLLVKLTSGSGTGALNSLTLLNDSKFSDNSADQTTNGNIMINVATPGYYSVAINPSANTPYPSDTDNTPTRIFIKKLA